MHFFFSPFSNYILDCLSVKDNLYVTTKDGNVYRIKNESRILIVKMNMKYCLICVNHNLESLIIDESCYVYRKLIDYNKRFLDDDKTTTNVDGNRSKSSGTNIYNNSLNRDSNSRNTLCNSGNSDTKEEIALNSNHSKAKNKSETAHNDILYIKKSDIKHNNEKNLEPINNSYTNNKKIVNLNNTKCSQNKKKSFNIFNLLTIPTKKLLPQKSTSKIIQIINSIDLSDFLILVNKKNIVILYKDRIVQVTSKEICSQKNRIINVFFVNSILIIVTTKKIAIYLPIIKNLLELINFNENDPNNKKADSNKFKKDEDKRKIIKLKNQSDNRVNNTKSKPENEKDIYFQKTHRSFNASPTKINEFEMDDTDKYKEDYNFLDFANLQNDLEKLNIKNKYVQDRSIQSEFDTRNRNLLNIDNGKDHVSYNMNEATNDNSNANKRNIDSSDGHSNSTDSNIMSLSSNYEKPKSSSYFDTTKSNIIDKNPFQTEINCFNHIYENYDAYSGINDIKINTKFTNNTIDYSNLIKTRKNALKNKFPPTNEICLIDPTFAHYNLDYQEVKDYLGLKHKLWKSTKSTKISKYKHRNAKLQNDRLIIGASKGIIIIYCLKTFKILKKIKIFDKISIQCIAVVGDKIFVLSLIGKIKMIYKDKVVDVGFKLDRHIDYIFAFLNDLYVVCGDQNYKCFLERKRNNFFTNMAKSKWMLRFLSFAFGYTCGSPLFCYKNCFYSVMDQQFFMYKERKNNVLEELDDMLNQNKR